MKWNSDPLDAERTKLYQEGAILTVFLLVCGAFILFALESPNRQSSELIAISLYTDRLADYSVDPLTTPLPIIGLNLIEDFLRDQEPRATGVIERAATAQAGLLTPVPTVTPRPDAGNLTPVIPTLTSTAPPTPENTSEPDITPTLTHTPISSLTTTITPTPSSTVTPTPVNTLIPTPVPTRTPAPNDPTNTPALPTNTSIPTSTPISVTNPPTSTPVQSTNTPLPTNTSPPTNTPLPTNTPPPTNTSPPPATPTATKPTPTTIPPITPTP